MRSHLPKWRPLTIDFLIIGAQKCGTSSLFTFLSKHPDISPTHIKEIGYFWNDKTYALGDEWYYRQFHRPILSNPFRQLHGLDVTPEYFYFHEIAAKRIYKFRPDMKLIITLRDPVQRAFSAYNMYKKIASTLQSSGNTWLDQYLSEMPRVIADPFLHFLRLDPFPSFTAAIRKELLELENTHDYLSMPSIVKGGLYAEQLRHYLTYFAPGQLLTIDSSDLKTRRSDTLRKITQFVGLSDVNWDGLDLEDQHVAKYLVQMEPKAKSILEEFYKPFDEELWSILGRRLSW